ncbi:WxL domain-containing protein [Lactiplantibacillus songbeiensis]|uniref:WxL domain-containing protein n=1 Tax=Lactiplantibacillus songbeiensis TaxID=2559920 RepID=A0ABW4C553_9LACO|nr:WxL domain-containing protein [Lactiplantibacillus songbeiensis]
MKKQLGLLTLGMTMALCLAAPIVGYAAEPGEQNATVTIEDASDAGAVLHAAPQITFTGLKNATDNVNTTGNVTGQLVVENTATKNDWEVTVNASDFMNKEHDKKLVYSNLHLGQGSVESDGPGQSPAISDITDWTGASKVMVSAGSGNLGKFTQTFGAVSIDVPKRQAAGEYESKVTWTLRQTVDGPGDIQKAR